MVYGFNDCTINVDLRELYRDSAPVAIRSQTFNVLVYLIEHRDHVVSTHELSDRLWAPRVVSESTLTSCIKEARRAVGDNGQAQMIIRTIHGHGYRFVAPLIIEANRLALTRSAETMLGSRQILLEAKGDRGPGSERPDHPTSVSAQPTPPVTADSETQSRTHPAAGEYKTVTVLVCGLADAKALTARLSSEGLHSLMQQLFGIALEVVQDFGGTVRRMLDDGIEVLFGILSDRQDHAKKAVRAALALRQRWGARSVNVETNEASQVAVTISVHTGRIILGTSLTNRQHLIITALGDTLELTHQLRRWAEPNTILLSGKTLRRVRGLVRVAAIEMPSAGAASPEVAYQLRGMRPLARPRRRY